MQSGNQYSTPLDLQSKNLIVKTKLTDIMRNFGQDEEDLGSECGQEKGLDNLNIILNLTLNVN